MELSAVREFLADNHHAVIATRRLDGGTVLSPVVCALDDEDKLVISTRETAMKVAHVRREPRASVVVLNDAFYGRFVQIEGPVEVVSLPAAMPGLIDSYRRIAGEHPDWAEYEAAMRDERRVLLRISIERAGPDRAG